MQFYWSQSGCVVISNPGLPLDMSRQVVSAGSFLQQKPCPERSKEYKHATLVPSYSLGGLHDCPCCDMQPSLTTRHVASHVGNAPTP
jgi:hypothetical protein